MTNKIPTRLRQFRLETTTCALSGKTAWLLWVDVAEEPEFFETLDLVVAYIRKITEVV